MKIIHNPSKCIGCGACAAVCSNYWQIGDDGLAHLKGAVINQETKNEELEINECACCQEAVNSCPVQAIQLLLDETSSE